MGKMTTAGQWLIPETAPRDGNPFIANVTGWPWAAIAAWNEHDDCFVYTTLQAYEMAEETVDRYFENEQARPSELRGWQPLPEILR